MRDRSASTLGRKVDRAEHGLARAGECRVRSGAKNRVGRRLAPWWADMSGIVLVEADLSRTDLRFVNLRGADLHSARLDAADLGKARLGGAFLGTASLRAADLRGAYLRIARFEGANLSGADLRSVEGLTRDQIDAAILDGETKLSDSLARDIHDGE
jgi:uncharacterized protein YjbI with pentapeptide repeats